ncbi:serine/threonine protein kinase [Neptuniibacter pectenicola]|jgi:Ser/Thr protein kinase RdoA (MazF antagonist)|uniref:serine/threonine protein kinase n=1 Tax=Neptuniibacter pectenicola TaxID=1806669 RepID=UPI000835E7AB|nr:serine/threonine protein kinase [Neptuniibacter pectenicola]|tara:strand:- start:4030 stop:5022 length:993 start_codon:yes stop_codon:yes gene_type:complete
MSEHDTSHPFERLTPAFLMDAVETQGFWCDGRTFPLNSYENRVYQVGIEEKEPLIAKFYRPNRWRREQILEEHEFCFELAEQELPIVTPLVNEAGQTLFDYQGFMFSLFPRRGGHAPELDNMDNLFVLGRLLGRMHRVGAVKPFAHRPEITTQNFGYDSVEFIRDRFIPADLKPAYESVSADLLQAIDEITQQCGEIKKIRVHGDCHTGNMLWRDDAPHFVDFDDARMAPAMQDIWMLLSGDRFEQTAQLSEIVDGYNEFNEFRHTELRLIEVLRSLRIMHYSAWLAKRWEDPAFPHSFSWFNTERYWGEHILELREQMAMLDQAPLKLC